MIQELREIKNEPFWMGAFFGSVMMLLTVLAFERLMATSDPSTVNMPKDIIQAYNMGHRDALKTNPPKLELEQTCLELWANKQPR
jgi:hypothetical protein